MFSVYDWILFHQMNKQYFHGGDSEIKFDLTLKNSSFL